MTATLKINLTHPQPGGGTVSIPQKEVSIPLAAQNAGEIDIPDGTADATQFTIPLGSIGTEITGLLILNNNNVAIGVRLASAVGDADLYSLAPGGLLLHAAPVSDDDNPLVAAAITTTAEQVGLGQVAYWVFGDPEAE